MQHTRYQGIPVTYNPLLRFKLVFLGETHGTCDVIAVFVVDYVSHVIVTNIGTLVSAGAMA